MAYSKLDAAMVRQIFAKKGKEAQRQVALEHGVSQMTVSMIWSGATWRSVTGMPPHVPGPKRVVRGNMHRASARERERSEL